MQILYGLVIQEDIDNTIDPLENISSDGVLTNLVSADGNYTLNSKKLKLRKKCIVFNATDGCFGYLKTPMEFEYLILNTLFDTNNIKEWVDVLKRCIREYTGDDYSIALAAMGFENYIELKKYYKNRFVELYNTYICKLKNADKNMVKNLWNNYKKVYERGMG